MYDDFNYKMVIGIRTDLGISKGKAAVLASQVAVLCSEEAKKSKIDWLKHWFSEGQKKVVVQIPSHEEMINLHKKAQQYNFSCAIIENLKIIDYLRDSILAIAIGPAPNDKIDKLTADYKLL
ncbi:MAG: aminoacyl-tRNA hydrolase [Candidatus Thorarchaeota archaeon]